MAKTSQPQTAHRRTANRAKKGAAAIVPSATKAEQIAMLLRRTEGASLSEMMKATGWQQHSLRGFMSGTIVKRRGLTIASVKTDGERRYRIVGAGTSS